MIFLLTNLLPRRATINADVVAAPDGSVTGDALVSDTENNTHYVTNADTFVVEAGLAYEFAAFAKAGARTVSRLTLGGSRFASASRAEFNLISGIVTYLGAGADTATIEPAGDGWYRLALVATATDTGNAWPEFYPMDASVGIGFAGDGVTEDIYFTDLAVVVNSVRERILQAVLASLRTIVGPTVKRDAALPERIPEGGLIVLRDNGDAPRADFAGADQYDLRLAIEVFADTDDPTVSIDGLQTRIAKALLADRTAGGLAVDLRPGSVSELDPLHVEGAAPFAARAIEFVADYWTVEGNPYLLAP